MDQELPIDLAVLKAANEYAGREETRYYLLGVLIEADKTGVYYVATDGHVMFVHRDAPSQFVGSLIIPSDIIATYRIDKRHPEASLIVGETCRIRHLGLSREFKPINGTFPKWRTVVPQLPEKEEPAQFSGAHIKKIWATAKQLSIGSPYIRHAGAGAATVTFERCGETFAVLMPSRVSAGDFPKWAQPTAAQVAA